MWTYACEQSFRTLKVKLDTSPVPSLLEGHDDFFVYNDASGIGHGCVLMRGVELLHMCPDN